MQVLQGPSFKFYDVSFPEPYIPEGRVTHLMGRHSHDIWTQCVKWRCGFARFAGVYVPQNLG